MRVAVAGYGDLTRYICEEFIKAGHVLVVLTRNHKPQLEDRKNITQVITDYTLSSLRAPLADCDVLISTISDMTSTYIDIHRTLVLACQESSKCKRFIPSEFVANIETYPDQPGHYYASREPIRELLRSQTNLEWTLVCPGWFTDYFVPGKNRHLKDIGDYHPIIWSNDDDKMIIIPGTGNEPIDFIWVRDVVSALASLINAPPGSWDPYTFMSGERSCWNDMVKRFQRKFRPNSSSKIQHLSLRNIIEIIKSAKDEETLILADFYLLPLSQSCAMPADKVRAHREKYFPDVRFRTLQEGFDQLDREPDLIF